MLKATIKIVITTFKRNECLERLLKSIPVELLEHTYIADQNADNDKWPWQEFYPGVQVMDLEYDCGLSYARNSLVKGCEYEYVLLLEDDFEFSPKTNINKMLTLLKTFPEAGVVGGVVEQNNVAINFEFIPTIEDGDLYHKHDGNNWKMHRDIKYKQTGCVMNFALFRSEVFDDVLWDPELKLREHQDFYVRMAKTDWKVLFTTDSAIRDAKPRHTEEYRAFKDRDEFMVKMMQKHGLKKIKYQNGSCRVIVDGKIVKYREPPIEK